MPENLHTLSAEGMHESYIRSREAGRNSDPRPDRGTQGSETISVRGETSAPSEAEIVQFDAESTDRVTLDIVWQRLSLGTWRVDFQFTTELRHYLVVQTGDQAQKGPDTELLMRTLLGERQKVVALETALSPSTITTRLSSVLVSMGFPPRPARVPILLVASAAMAKGRVHLPQARQTRLTTPDGEYVVLSMPRLDAHLRTLLTPAEWLVARLLVDGLSHREIAARRGSTTRTVANQVASVFRKLDVSGRRELLLRALIEHVDATRQPEAAYAKDA